MKKIFRRLLFWLGISILFFIAYFVYIVDDALSISKGIPISHYETHKTALVVIDVQEGISGTYAREQYYIDQAPDLIGNINEVISVVYENDVPVIYILQQTENWLLNWGDDYAMAPGSPGVAIDSRLKNVSLDHFTKRKSDAFSSYDFEKYLQALQIDRLIITGIDIAYCAGKTSYAAKNRGYEVIVVEEAVISESEEMKKEKLSELKATGIKIVSSDELYQYLDDCLIRGYEGCMVRNFDAKYKFKRSYDLQKLKKFDDDEFRIIDVKVGTKGSMAGKAVFICEKYRDEQPLGEGETFDVKLRGNMDELTKYANDPSLVIGKILTVKFQGYTKYGIPRFPVGERFRVEL